MSKQQAIKEDLRRKIRDEEYRERIPPERTLAKDYGVSVLTVRRAIGALASEGLVYRRQGSGTFVNVAGANRSSAEKNLVALLSKPPKTLHYPLPGLISEKLNQIGFLTMYADPNDESFLADGGKRFEEILSYDPEAVVIDGDSRLPHERLLAMRKAVPRMIFVNTASRRHVYDASYILADVWLAWRMATRHLIDLGHRRVVMKACGMNYPPEEVRFHASYEAYCGYRDALAEAGLNGAELLLGSPEADPRFDQEFDAMFAAKDHPTAMVCHADYVAVRVIKLLEQRGIRVPDDVAVVGMNNTPWAEEMVPSLTTVDFRFEKMAGLIADRIQRAEGPSEMIRVEPRLIIRSSCGGSAGRADRLPMTQQPGLFTRIIRWPRPARRYTMSEHRNVLVLHADQLRFDGLSVNGAPAGLTPNLDALAACGCNFTRHIAGNPVCMPSRASLLSGLYPPGHGVWNNGIPLNRSCYNPPATQTTQRHSPGFDPCIEIRTMADMFSQGGYDTFSLGKLHLTPNLAPASFGFEESYESWRTGRLDDWTGPYFGFDHVEFVQGHGEFPITEGGHYANWLRETAPDLVADIEAGKHHTKPLKKRDLYLSLLPSELHHSPWLARRFDDMLGTLNDERPFFAFVGFPDPHHPFTPPYDSLEAVAGFDLPTINDPRYETDSMPLRQHHGAAPRLEEKTGVREYVQRYTMAMIHLLDKAVGTIVQSLKDRGKWDDTVVIFTADHGDFLGDHGCCYKALRGCNSLLHVPFIMRGPGIRAGTVNDDPVSNVDVLPTLAALTRVQPPARLHGRDLLAPGAEPLAFAYAPDVYDPAWNNVTVYDRETRLSLYPGQDYGELFDHRSDYAEIHNAVADPAHSERVAYLCQAILEAGLHHHTPLAGRVCCF